MQAAVTLSQQEAVRTQAAAEHLRKQEAIVRCIEKYAEGNVDFWLTYSEISEYTGIHIRDVIRTVYNSGDCFLESSWRMRDAQMLATVRKIYHERTGFWAKVFACFLGQRD